METKNYATWHLELNTECPHCKEYVDLLDYTDFWDGRKFEPIEHNTRHTENVEVHCPKCDEDFIVDFEY
jgi:phage FluMu protein Com